MVEDLVEGAFGLILRGKIQPLEIARRLTREAEEQKIITLNRVFVPNRYVVSLHPADLSTLQPISTELQAEFQRFVGEWVIDRDYAVTGPIGVQLTPNERVGRGRIKVQALLDDVRSAEETARKRMGFELQVLAEETEGYLEVVEGPDSQRVFTLLPRPMTVGSAPDCDIRLNDPSVSMRQAVIRPDGDTWRAEELNGGPYLLINEEDNDTGRLEDGDTLRFGKTICRFRMAEVKGRALDHAA